MTAGSAAGSVSPLETHLILGGARSGKSRHAVELARGAAGRVAVVATAEAGDADLTARIARHRAERPAAWATVEEPRELVAACRRAAEQADLVLVDCVTLWVANRMLGGDADSRILGATDELTRLMGERPAALILISNEVGGGVHPPTADGLRYRDLLGLVNQRVAAAADRVTLMVAGLAMTVKAPAVPVPDLRGRYREETHAP
ncbi:MAG TPA: bifunctional adenosylcobinamide kinase/adenosylcobinamide-phosphate guanylyltransferase [Methylomirabilota bacterium]|nr:bifunctional adenosylcobinamide kinase/adenosylcobinamide-phosphate guanylyltransferase [Methylomirabilota bacterium]